MKTVAISDTAEWITDADRPPPGGLLITVNTDDDDEALAVGRRVRTGKNQIAFSNAQPA